MANPYREMATERVPTRRSLDPWMLALLFAWVCCVGRIGVGLLDRKPVDGELGFAAFLAVVTAFVGGVTVRRKRR
jgi:hypothetical protein